MEDIFSRYILSVQIVSSETNPGLNFFYLKIKGVLKINSLHVKCISTLWSLLFKKSTTMLMKMYKSGQNKHLHKTAQSYKNSQ